MKKILIIEDDESIARLEKDYLEVSGYTAGSVSVPYLVNIVEDGQKGLAEGLQNDYDLIVLDIMLPGMDGMEICKALRAEKDTPILMVTAKNSDIDKIRGLGLGADDYMTKPFSMNEFVARVTAHIGRYESLTQKGKRQVIHIRGLKIDMSARRVTVDDQDVSLSNKEFELLAYLAQNPDKVFSKDKLMDRIWGYEAYAEPATVTVHINRIREKIEKNLHAPPYIETVWGSGYRFRI